MRPDTHPAKSKAGLVRFGAILGGFRERLRVGPYKICNKFVRNTGAFQVLGLVGSSRKDGARAYV